LTDNTVIGSQQSHVDLSNIEPYGSFVEHQCWLEKGGKNTILSYNKNRSQRASFQIGV